MTNNHATEAVRGDARWDAYRAGFLAGASDAARRDNYEQTVALAEGAASAYVDARPAPTPPHPTVPARGEPTDHLVWSNEHNAWWAPNECGYRANILQAGLYTKTRAEDICRGANYGSIENERAVPLAEKMGELLTLVGGAQRMLAAAMEETDVFDARVRHALLHDPLVAAAFALGREDGRMYEQREMAAQNRTVRQQLAARDAELAGRMDLLEAAWGIIANAGGGDWERESQEWQQAAARWREQYHAVLDAARSGAGQEG